MRQSFWKKVLAAWLSFLLIFMASLVPGLDGTAAEGAVTVSAPSAILLEAQTGTVIFEKDDRPDLLACQYYQDYDAAADF